MAAVTDFRDLFSARAACYARARPGYPAALFDYLASVAPRRGLAWDCGTGNGQAAVGLAAHFERVIATDSSAAQIAHATPHPRVAYRVAPAESADLEPKSVDLIAVAQALHWFDLDAFYANVRRAAAPGCVIAAWCYTLPRVSPALDAVCARFYRDVAGPYWAPQRRFIDERYESIHFPFNESEDQNRDRKRVGNSFACRADWNLNQYFDYLSSWSAVQQYKTARGRDPVDEVRADLTAAWGAEEAPRSVTWPIHLRVGRIESSAPKSVVALPSRGENRGQS